ncbi:MAG TPA: 3-phosphoshikimate 1-carboxyvinyltransferase, partial [Candidatus Prevotella stercoripullorum]|nr:3-phosphoshikimate 1-carboxyvinyltransferase [Candidatus Prevotella stercoripullorum]
SISNRALVMNALAGSKVMPDNLSDCDDTRVILDALRRMPETIDIGAAGTAMRFMTAYLAVTPGCHTLTGTERMKHRPIRALVDALRYIGADIAYEGEDGYPPLRINGRRLEGGRLEIPGDISSQYISALLMVGPVLERGLELRLTGEIISRPYIDLTLCMMRGFGADAEWTDVDTISVRPVPYGPRPFFIENDWSAASYWYETLVLARDGESEVRLDGLTDGSRQGDSAVKYLFSMLGVRTVFKTRERGVPTTVTLKRVEPVPPRLDYDFVNQPDMVQTFVVCCALAGVPFRFTGLASLKIKETDRVEALKTEMRKLGYVVRETAVGELSWDGERCQQADDLVINTYEDHRMAMAFAPAAMVFPGLKIDEPQVVSKSYPHFWDELRRAGFTITEER